MVFMVSQIGIGLKNVVCVFTFLAEKNQLF